MNTLNRSANAEQLSAAFALFEGASRELSASYSSLEDQVKLLTAELAHSHAAQARELEEKQRLAARLDNLLQALPGGVVVLDQHGLVQEFNLVASDLLGRLQVGEAWSAVVARAFTPRWDDGHDISLSDGRVLNIATQALKREPGQILLLKDVTQTRRLLEQLAHHKRLSAKTEMAAAIAHQIRTPLSCALLYIGNVARSGSEALRARSVDRALTSLRKLERLVDDMLLFARGGQFDVCPVTGEALMSALQIAASEAFNFADFSIEFGPCCAPASVHVNLAALTSAALNLIENSYHASSGRGHIRVDAGCRDGALELGFQDDGPGISVQQQALIFEPFHSTRSNGTGLGLPVARAVARAHAGDLVLAECATGSRFVLHLPLIERVADEATAQLGAPINSSHVE